MVHSSSASPMKNSPSASLHFTAAATAPPLSEPAPPLSEPAPPLSEPAPPLSEPAPPLSEPAPPLSEPAPPLSEPAPPLSEPEPPLSEPTPPLSEPAPPLSEPEPPLSEPTPPLSEPAPPLSEPEPPLSEPTPPLSEPAPPLSEPEPPLSEPTPPLSEPAPPLSEPAPPLSEPEPPLSEPFLSEPEPSLSEPEPPLSEPFLSEPSLSEPEPSLSEPEPPLSASPPVLPPADATGQGSTPTTDPSSVALDHGSRPSACSSTPVSRPAHGPVNGRTSGRKRTPKACDCCGPNSSGHNVQTSGRGRGRGRGRPSSNELWETPKRKVGGQLIKTKRKVDEAERGDARRHEVLSVATSPEAGPRPDRGAGETGEALEKEVVLVEESGGEGAADGRRVDLRISGGRGRPAAEGGTTRGPLGGVVIKTCPSPQPVFVRRQGPDLKMDLRDQLELRDQPDHSFIKFACGNGDTVNLSDTEPEEETKENFVTQLENGQLSGSGSPQDLDSDMQVDQTPPSLPLPNGDITTPSGEDQCCTTMEVEASLPAPPQGSITVSGVLHRWALTDHQLYCRPGTWEKEQSAEDGGDKEGRRQEEDEGLEQLTDLIHEFLESFYLKYGGFIPLSETDVLEYLKKKNGGDDLVSRGLDIKKEVTRYRAGLASAPIAGFMVKYNKHTLSLEDLSTLEEQNWLNDQIINMYGELIMEATQHKVHFFNSFFHKQLVAKGYEGVKRWTKKVDLFSKWLLLIPIHLEIHWSLVTVTMATKTISYYDSQGIVFRHTTDNIMKYLLSEARERKQTLFQKGWKISIIKGIPQQKNDSDCGVFVLEYCRCLSVKQPLLFSQDDMPRIRKRIYKELCDCRLNH